MGEEVNIYVVMEQVPWEGEFLVSIHSTWELADAEVRRLLSEYGDRVLCVDTWVLDGGRVDIE